MLSDLALSVRGVSKSYTIAHNQVQHSTLAEAALHRIKHPMMRLEKETFWALKDVNFDIRQGDVVGIVGRNGAGKSTLLKILSRITEPTTGQIDVYGRIGSLLEVGTGFHPELTGRENIYLNGQILGMRKKEISGAFDAIVDFSGVEQFLDTPVKRYSSGMYVRLAFAVAAHLSSEILVVDEVLAVGDAEFQRKCLGKMKDVARGGRTVLFVSHHMQSVAVLCNRAMYMEKGQVKFVGDVQGGIQHYVASFNRPTAAQMDPQRRPGSGEMRFVNVTAGEDSYACGDEKVVRFKVKRFKPYAGKFFVSCHVADQNGFTLLQCDSRMVGTWFEAADEVEGEFRLRTPWLKPGAYRVDLFLCAMGVQDRFEEACELNVIPLLPYPTAGNDEATSQGVVFGDFDCVGVGEKSEAFLGQR
jgi:lipopolysaccharide transport system ATP-binding protein